MSTLSVATKKGLAKQKLESEWGKKQSGDTSKTSTSGCRQMHATFCVQLSRPICSSAWGKLLTQISAGQAIPYPGPSQRGLWWEHHVARRKQGLKGAMRSHGACDELRAGPWFWGASLLCVSKFCFSWRAFLSFPGASPCNIYPTRPSDLSHHPSS